MITTRTWGSTSAVDIVSEKSGLTRESQFGLAVQRGAVIP